MKKLKLPSGDIIVHPCIKTSQGRFSSLARSIMLLSRRIATLVVTSALQLSYAVQAVTLDPSIFYTVTRKCSCSRSYTFYFQSQAVCSVQRQGVRMHPSQEHAFQPRVRFDRAGPLGEPLSLLPSFRTLMRADYRMSMMVATTSVTDSFQFQV
jgi:hypothetical protein